ncbi:MAG: hypothetical protein AB1578_11010 [Thermodesulfobacteriota bacterium]|jgi:hypothetical protein
MGPHLSPAGRKKEAPGTGPAAATPRSAPPAIDALYIPLLWDPIHLLAAEVLRSTWEPVRRRVTEALTVVLELASGSRVRLKDAEIAAFYFTLLKVLSATVPLSEERRAVFLQEAAACIYFGDRLSGFPDSASYWEFLTQRHAEYAAAARKARDTKPLITFVDHFLCYFGLGGSENVDVVYGLYRFLSPLLAEAAQRLRERTAEACGNGSPS